MEPIDGAPQALRRLATEGVWIRVATHRLFIPNFHQIAVEQTIGWLENHDIRYWDLCLIEDKAAIRADLFIEDNPKNIRRLLANKTDTICMTNPTNQDATDITRRAKNWAEAEEMIRKKYYKWRVDRSLKLPERHGMEPEDEKDSEKSDE
jgi:5'(3')-deoxyribonucleotidase